MQKGKQAYPADIVVEVYCAFHADMKVPYVKTLFEYIYL